MEKTERKKRDEQRLRFERKFPRVVRVIEPQGCLSREMCVQMCKCLRIFSFWLITLTMTRLILSPLKSWPGTCRGMDRRQRKETFQRIPRASELCLVMLCSSRKKRVGIHFPLFSMFHTAHFKHFSFHMEGAQKHC